MSKHSNGQRARARPFTARRKGPEERPEDEAVGMNESAPDIVQATPADDNGVEGDRVPPLVWGVGGLTVLGVAAAGLGKSSAASPATHRDEDPVSHPRGRVPEVKQLDATPSERMTPDIKTTGETTPRDVTPQDVTPQDVTRQDVTPKGVTSEKVTSQDVIPRKEASEHTAPEAITPNNTTIEKGAPEDAPHRATSPQPVTPEEMKSSTPAPESTESGPETKEPERQVPPETAPESVPQPAIEAPRPPAPTLHLADDTGVPGDGQTRFAATLIGGLVEGATWQYSLDGGQTWLPGDVFISPADVAALVDGPQSLLARQRVGENGEFSEVGRLEFHLDRKPPAVPQLDFQPTKVHRDTGERQPAVVAPQWDRDGTLHWGLPDGEPVGSAREERVDLTGELARLGALQAWQEDDAGNAGARLALDIDIMPPAAPMPVPEHPVRALPTDGTLRMRAGGLRLHGLEEGARWSWSIDGDAWREGSGDVLEDSRLREPGLHELRMLQIDAHGNESDLLRRDVEVMPPFSLRLRRDTGISDSDLHTFDARIVLAGLDPVAAGWEFRINGGPWQRGEGSEIAASRFPKGQDGEQRVEVRTLDGDAGELERETLSFTLDRVAPAITPQLVTLAPTGEVVTADGTLIAKDDVPADGYRRGSLGGWVDATGEPVWGYLRIQDPSVGIASGGDDGVWGYAIRRPHEVLAGKTEVHGDRFNGGDDLRLPELEFQERGPYIVSAGVFDKAGNDNGLRYRLHLFFDGRRPAGDATDAEDSGSLSGEVPEERVPLSLDAAPIPWMLDQGAPVL